MFRRCNNVVDVQTTLYQRRNDVVYLLGVDWKSFEMYSLIFTNIQGTISLTKKRYNINFCRLFFFLETKICSGKVISNKFSRRMGIYKSIINHRVKIKFCYVVFRVFTFCDGELYIL